MKSRLPITVGMIIVVLAFINSCSGAATQSENPTTPNLTLQNTPSETGRYLWAYYEFNIDPIANTVESIPVRNVEDHWNVVKFLEKGPCTNCVKVLGLTPTGNGTKIFDVQIEHPFQSPTFTGFDVRGIAMFAGSHTFPVSGLTTPDGSSGDGQLVNADGFTTLYNGTTAGSGPNGLQGYIKGKFTSPQTPNALLNGFKNHISPGVTNTRNAFYAGSAVLVSYEIDMPDSTFILGYGVDASWTLPTVKPPTNVMTDFPPEANCPEPWKIDVTVNPIGQGLTDQGGEAVLSINVYDHQGKDSHFAPVVECPELFDGSVNGLYVSEGIDYATYEATVENVKIAPQGEYMCLFSVKDTEDSTAPPHLDLTGYNIVMLEVGEFQTQANQPPTAAAHADKTNGAANETISFFDDSTDPDGLADIVKREWDFSFDVIDGFNPGSEEQNPQISYPSNGNYLVQLRVTDTENHQDLLDTPIQIVISGGGDNDPPIACGDASLYHVDIKIPPTTVSFSDCSFDPDGFTDMVLFEWDLDGDGTYEKFGQNTSKVYQTAGDYNVQHRVTDTVNNQDILDEPILIEVNAKPVASAEADQLNIQFGDFVTITNTSVDDDGNGPIDQVLWDVDGNGKYDDPDDIQGTDQIILSFFEAGVHQIGLKVVDEWGLADELDTKLEITVEGFPTFCVGLDDQYNSASSLYGTRSFKYFNDSINNLGGLTYKAANGPWDFNEVPASPPAICEWLLPSDPEVSQAKSLWPDADFFFKESAPGSGFQLVPHRFDFDPGPGPGPNGELVIQGQWEGTGVDFQYGDIFHITHEICHPWLDSGSGTSVFSGVEFDTTWTMTTLGTGPAIFTVNGETVILNCMLIRHNMSFVDTEFGFLTFSLLNYQWIDEDGNEVAFMQASNGLDGNNFSGSSYTGTVICRSLQSIS